MPRFWSLNTIFFFHKKRSGFLKKGAGWKSEVGNVLDDPETFYQGPVRLCQKDPEANFNKFPLSRDYTNLVTIRTVTAMN